MSPADSAFGSGVPSGMASSVPSGVQTKAQSEVAPGDLEQLDPEDGALPQTFGERHHCSYVTREGGGNVGGSRERRGEGEKA